MFLKYAYAHKASFVSSSQAPIIDRPLCTHRVLSYWNEATIGSSGPAGLPLGSGADSTCMSTVVLTSSNGFQPDQRSDKYVAFDVTAAAKAWANGSPNYGILVRDINENTLGRDRRFYSSESSYKPYLEVECLYR